MTFQTLTVVLPSCSAISLVPLSGASVPPPVPVGPVGPAAPDGPVGPVDPAKGSAIVPPVFGGELVVLVERVVMTALTGYCAPPSTEARSPPFVRTVSPVRDRLRVMARGGRVMA